MSKPSVSQEEWEAWLVLPASMALREWAKERREGIRDRWEFGSLTGENEFQHGANQLAAIGACSVLRDIEALEYDDIFGDSIGPVKRAEGDG